MTHTNGLHTDTTGACFSTPAAECKVFKTLAAGFALAGHTAKRSVLLQVAA